MALMSYLVRDKHGTYDFRRVVPAELRGFMPPPWIGKANWKRSLGTKDPATAKRAAARSLADCTRDFDAAERAKRGERPLPDQTHFASLEDIERDTVDEQPIVTSYLLVMLSGILPLGVGQ
jgi:hypothetical protein